MAGRMYADKHSSVSEICRTLGITGMTLWRYVRAGERDATGWLEPASSGTRSKLRDNGVVDAQQ